MRLIRRRRVFSGEENDAENNPDISDITDGVSIRRKAQGGGVKLDELTVAFQKGSILFHSVEKDLVEMIRLGQLSRLISGNDTDGLADTQFSFDLLVSVRETESIRSKGDVEQQQQSQGVTMQRSLVKVTALFNALHLAIVAQQENIVSFLLGDLPDQKEMDLIQSRVVCQGHSGRNVIPKDKWIFGANAFHLAARFHPSALKTLVQFARKSGVKRLETIQDLPEQKQEEQEPEVSNQVPEIIDPDKFCSCLGDAKKLLTCQHNKSQVTPLHIAARNEDSTATILLLRACRPDSLTDTDSRGYNALHEAAKVGTPASILAILDKCPDHLVEELVNAKGHVSGKTPLFRARTKLAVKILLEYGADPAAKMTNKKNYVFQHLLKYHSETVDVLLDHMVTANKPTLEGDNLLLVYDFSIFKSTTTIQEAEEAERELARKLKEKPTVKAKTTIRKSSSSSSSSSSNSSSEEESNDGQEVNPLRRRQHHDNQVNLKSHKNNLDLHFDLINSNRTDLLLHPVMRLFLYLKWSQARVSYFLNLGIYIMFVGCLTFLGTCFVNVIQCEDIASLEGTCALGLAGISCIRNVTMPADIQGYYQVIPDLICHKGTWELKNGTTFTLARIQDYVQGSEEPGSLVAFDCWKWLTLAFLFYLLGREVSQGMSKGYMGSIFSYFHSLENLIEVTIIVLGFMFWYCMEWKTDVAGHMGGWCIFLAWIDLTLFLGRLPMFGTNIYMSLHVTKDLGWSLIVYLPTLIAFALGFHMFLYTTSVFHGFRTSIIKIFVMMVGELEFSDYFTREAVHESGGRNWSAQLMLIMFMITVGIIIMNLLIGLTVSKTEDLMKQAEIIMMEKRTREVSHLTEWEMSISKKLEFLQKSRLMRILNKNKNFKVCVRYQEQRTAKEKKTGLVEVLRKQWKYIVSVLEANWSKRFIYLYDEDGKKRAKKTGFSINDSILESTKALIKDKIESKDKAFEEDIKLARREIDAVLRSYRKFESETSNGKENIETRRTSVAGSRMSLTLPSGLDLVKLKDELKAQMNTYIDDLFHKLQPKQ